MGPLLLLLLLLITCIEATKIAAGKRQVTCNSRCHPLLQEMSLVRTDLATWVGRSLSKRIIGHSTHTQSHLTKCVCVYVRSCAEKAIEACCWANNSIAIASEIVWPRKKVDICSFVVVVQSNFLVRFGLWNYCMKKKTSFVVVVVLCCKLDSFAMGKLFASSNLKWSSQITNLDGEKLKTTNFDQIQFFW